jgi:MYXO-CTERM domain-containing protein
VKNPNQFDDDADGYGNACDPCPEDWFNDADGDGICGDVDNCPAHRNSNQADADEDGIGDACDSDFQEQPPFDVDNESGGCDCRVAGAGHASSGLGAFAALLMAGMLRRFRRSA